MHFSKTATIFIIFSLLILTDFLHAEETRHAKTQQGVSVELSRIHYWKKTCSPLPISVKLVIKPQYGEVKFQEIDSTIGNFGGGKLMQGSLRECIGLPIKAIQVIYIPKSEFTGSDQFSIYGGPGSEYNKTILWNIQVE